MTSPHPEVAMEQRIQDVIRWNAMMMVTRETSISGGSLDTFRLTQVHLICGRLIESLSEERMEMAMEVCLLARSCKSRPVRTGLDGRSNE